MVMADGLRIGEEGERRLRRTASRRRSLPSAIEDVFGPGFLCSSATAMPSPSDSVRTPVPPSLRRLAALLPPDRLLCEQAELAAYESDGLTAYKARPLAIAVPETQQEVIEIVRACRAENLPFVARGSGTSLSGGSLPVAGGIVITLNRLRRILALG